MSQQAIVLSAQQGDADAIASLINQAFAQKNITATTRLEGNCLQVTLLSEQIPPQDTCVYVISEGIKALGIPSIKSVQVNGQQPHSQSPAWSQTFDLLSFVSFPAPQPAKPNPPSLQGKTAAVKLPPSETIETEPKLKPPLLWSNFIVWFLVVALGIALKFQPENRQVNAPKKSSTVPQTAAVIAKAPAPKPPITPPTKRRTSTVKLKPRSRMTLKKTIAGKISPKSIVHSGQGLFFAQNMMYSHTITVYNRKHQLVRTIPDRVNLAKFGYKEFKGNYRGAPVEASFSHNGKYAWISNYQMYGREFNNPGSDRCNPSQNHDDSFLYRINTQTFQIEKAIQVGSVPKFVATTPDNRLVLVSNWCSWDLSVIDTQKNQEIKRIKLGAYPRGIVVDSAAKIAYVAVMGSSHIAKVDLSKYSVKWLRNIGRSPRHLNLDPAGKYLYASLNGEGRLAKIDLSKRKVVDKVVTGNAPRSMVLSDDGERLYVVNYGDNTVSKVRTKDLKVLQRVKVAPNPIGITFDPQTRQVWVACYSGQIMVFQD
jgi:YVTN family beta-propeller protein